MTDKDLGDLGVAAGDIISEAFHLGYETCRNQLIPAGGMALTAEQVEDVRLVLDWINDGAPRGGIRFSTVNRIWRALFPATEPTEEAPADLSPTAAPIIGTTTHKSIAGTCNWCRRSISKHHAGTSWFHSKSGNMYCTPTPAEPAEEETKAERDSQGIIRINGGRIVALSRDPRELVQQWYDLAEPGSKWQRDYAAALDLFDREAASSPVVPAPTETGPWQRIEDVPEGVFVVASGAVYVGGPVWRTSGLRDGVNRSAPFFASVEEQS